MQHALYCVTKLNLKIRFLIQSKTQLESKGRKALTLSATTITSIATLDGKEPWHRTRALPLNRRLLVYCSLFTYC